MLCKHKRDQVNNTKNLTNLMASGMSQVASSLNHRSPKAMDLLDTQTGYFDQAHDLLRYPRTPAPEDSRCFHASRIFIDEKSDSCLGILRFPCSVYVQVASARFFRPIIPTI